MATKEVLTEDEDDKEVLEVVEVDNLPAPGEPAKVKVEPEEKEPEDPDYEDDEGDEDEPKEDARLAEREDEVEESDAKKHQRARRQRQKETRAREREEFKELKRNYAELQRRVSGVEGANLATGESQVEARLSEVRKDIATSEIILARAIEEGKGEDAAAAIRLRDEAKTQEMDLVRAKEAFTEARKPKETTTSAAAEFAAQWKTANPWYKQDGSDNASAVVNAIDVGMVQEGYNPNERGYWAELTRRVQARTAAPRQEREEPANGKERKKAPPQGNGREHAPNSTRREVYVTPERKAAMQEAGYWDDPKERAKMLKAYADFDREQSAR